jgi:hypothetical protein
MDAAMVAELQRLITELRADIRASISVLAAAAAITLDSPRTAAAITASGSRFTRGSGS